MRPWSFHLPIFDASEKATQLERIWPSSPPSDAMRSFVEQSHTQRSVTTNDCIVDIQSVRPTGGAATSFAWSLAWSRATRNVDEAEADRVEIRRGYWCGCWRWRHQRVGRAICVRIFASTEARRRVSLDGPSGSSNRFHGLGTPGPRSFCPGGAAGWVWTRPRDLLVGEGHIPFGVSHARSSVRISDHGRRRQVRSRVWI